MPRSRECAVSVGNISKIKGEKGHERRTFVAENSSTRVVSSVRHETHSLLALLMDSKPLDVMRGPHERDFHTAHCSLVDSNVTSLAIPLDLIDDVTDMVRNPIVTLVDLFEEVLDGGKTRTHLDVDVAIALEKQGRVVRDNVLIAHGRGGGSVRRLPAAVDGVLVVRELCLRAERLRVVTLANSIRDASLRCARVDHDLDDAVEARLGDRIRKLSANEPINVQRSMNFVAISEHDQNVSVRQTALLELDDPSVGRNSAKNTIIENIVLDAAQFLDENAGNDGEAICRRHLVADFSSLRFEKLLDFGPCWVAHDCDEEIGLAVLVHNGHIILVALLHVAVTANKRRRKNALDPNGAQREVGATRNRVGAALVRTCLDAN